MRKFIRYAAPALAACGAFAADVPPPADAAPLPVERVWAGHPVGFALLTAGKHQFVAYYDAERRLTVASRELPGTAWKFKKLPTSVGWDSHNYVTLTLDRDNLLHLAGNMHCVPLIYFRGDRPFDIDSLEAVPAMTGDRETHCTYPRFYRNREGRLIFRYRDGRSGNGDDLYNVYDEKNRKWQRLLDRPLMTGNGKMNAYATDPVPGPDGMFHLTGVWRDSPDCATNHDLFYLRSPDLVHWETAEGRALPLPVTVATPGLTIDPTPAGKGLINMGISIGFDGGKRPVVTYHKYKSDGSSQLYAARFEDGRWMIRQLSDWRQRWEFRGGGSIANQVGGGPVALQPDGSLRCNFANKIEKKSGTWVLDPATLAVRETLPAKSEYPAGLGKVTGAAPGLQVNFRSGEGRGPNGERYFLRWETLGANRDQRRPEPWPEPSELTVFELPPETAAR